MKFKTSILMILSLIYCASAFATGYEKPIMFSGKYGGMAGAATSSVAGPESLYFNPAGLVDTRGTAFTLDVSPLRATATAPVQPVGTSNALVTQGAQPIDSKTTKSTPFAVLGSANLGNNYAIGVGFYPIAGGGLDFGAVDYGSNFSTMKPSAKSSLTFTELAVGGSVKVTSGFKIGAAWRMTQATGEIESSSLSYLNFADVLAAQAGGGFTVAQILGMAGLVGQPAVDTSGSEYGYIPTALVAVKMDKLKNTNFGGFKVGFKIGPDSNEWGIGVSYRSPVKYRLMGKSSARILTSTQIPAAFQPGGAFDTISNLLGTPGTGLLTIPTGGVLTNYTGGNIIMETELPQMIDFGLHYDFFRAFRVALGYSLAQYSSMKKLKFAGDMIGPAIDPVNLTRTIDWKNMHQARLGMELRLGALALRSGYSVATGVTPNDRTIYDYQPPGTNHDISVGAGINIKNKLSLDGAFDYGWNRGWGKGVQDTDFLGGKYEIATKTLHTGISYKF